MYAIIMNTANSCCCFKVSQWWRW